MKLFLKNLLFTVVVPGTVTVWLPYAWFWGQRDFESAPWRWLAYVLITAGTAVYLRCVADFMFAGRGTPAPIDPPKTLVARGLYRYVRNPMYLGAGLAMLGAASYYGSPVLLAYVAGFMAACHALVRLYEEPALHRLFGAEYDVYRALTPRWLPGRGSSGGGL